MHEWGPDGATKVPRVTDIAHREVIHKVQYNNAHTCTHTRMHTCMLAQQSCTTITTIENSESAWPRLLLGMGQLTIDRERPIHHSYLEPWPSAIYCIFRQTYASSLPIHTHSTVEDFFWSETYIWLLERMGSCQSVHASLLWTVATGKVVAGSNTAWRTLSPGNGWVTDNLTVTMGSPGLLTACGYNCFQ